MAKVTYSYYPNGFRVANRMDNQTPNRAVTPDVELTHLMSQYMTDGLFFEQWANRRLLVDAAVRLFGDLGGFLLDQQYNTQLDQHALRFVAETLEYIETGHRPISVHTRSSLIEAPVGVRVADVDSMANSRKHVVSLQGRSVTRGVALLSQWLGRPEGFDDFLQTLWVFFGPRAKR